MIALSLVEICGVIVPSFKILLGSYVVLKVTSAGYKTIIKIYLILTTVDFLVIRNLAGEIAQEYAKRQVWNLSFARVVLALFCRKCEIDSPCAPYHYNGIIYHSKYMHLFSSIFMTYSISSLSILPHVHLIMIPVSWITQTTCICFHGRV